MGPSERPEESKKQATKADDKTKQGRKSATTATSDFSFKPQERTPVSGRLSITGGPRPSIAPDSLEPNRTGFSSDQKGKGSEFDDRTFTWLNT